MNTGCHSRGRDIALGGADASGWVKQQKTCLKEVENGKCGGQKLLGFSDFHVAFDRPSADQVCSAGRTMISRSRKRYWSFGKSDACGNLPHEARLRADVLPAHPRHHVKTTPPKLSNPRYLSPMSSCASDSRSNNDEHFLQQTCDQRHESYQKHLVLSFTFTSQINPIPK